MPTWNLGPFLALTVYFGILAIILTLRVSMRRVHLGGVSFGDAGDADLQSRIRAHGNFAEHAPVAALLTLALCLSGLSSMLGWSLSGAFAATRTVHAWSILDPGRTAFRAGAMLVQHAATGIAVGLVGWSLVG